MTSMNCCGPNHNHYYHQSEEVRSILLMIVTQIEKKPTSVKMSGGKNPPTLLKLLTL